MFLFLEQTLWFWAGSCFGFLEWQDGVQIAWFSCYFNGFLTRSSFKIFLCSWGFLGHGRNTVSRVLFRKGELTDFYGKLAEFCDKLCKFAPTHKCWLKGTHRALSPELGSTLCCGSTCFFICCRLICPRLLTFVARRFQGKFLFFLRWPPPDPSPTPSPCKLPSSAKTKE